MVAAVAVVVAVGWFPVAGLVLEVVQHIVQLFGDQVGLLEGLAALAVEEGHQGGFADVGHGHGGAAFVGGDGGGGFVHYDVAAQAVHLVLGADVGNQFQDVVGHCHIGQALLAGDDAFPFRLFVGGPVVHKAEGFGFKGHSAADDGAAFRRGEYAVHFHRQSEAVQELGAQVAFLRVHSADEHKLGGVAYGDALAFHIVAAHCGGVQQHIHQVVVEQVDFVNVEDAPVGGGDEARLEVFGAGFDGLFNVQGADQAILGGAHGEVNDAYLAGGGGAAASGLAAPGADFLGRAGGAAVGAARHDRHFGQQGGQGAHGGAFGGAFFAAHQDAADAGVDGVEEQRPFHRGLPHNGGEGEPGFPAGRRRGQRRHPFLQTLCRRYAVARAGVRG